MARGNIYYISKNRDTDVHFRASDYYDCLGSLDIEYVEDRDREGSTEAMLCLLYIMKNLGASIFNADLEADDGFQFSFCFYDADTAKRKYFAPRLEQLKKDAAALTLDEAVRTAPMLDRFLDNEFGDLVEFNEGSSSSISTLDNFIRHMESGVTYYMYGRVILIH